MSLPCLTGCRKWRLNGHARRIDERRFPHGGAPPSRKEAGWHPRAAQSSHVTDGCRWGNLVRQRFASRGRVQRIVSDQRLTEISGEVCGCSSMSRRACRRSASSTSVSPGPTCPSASAASVLMAVTGSQGGISR